jgi:lysozyme family protein
MTASNFSTCLALTLVYEGGYAAHPKDPGGATMCGVTQRVYDEDRDARRLPRQPVRLSAEAERAAIYRRRYWDTCRGNDLPTGVDYAVFDFAVNSGVGRAAKVLQAIVGAVVDGDLGPVTLARVRSYCANHHATALIDALCLERDRFLRSLSLYTTFGAGWTRRVMGVKPGAQPGDTGVIDRAWAMAMQRAVAVPTAPVATPKTYLADARRAA